MKIDEILPPSRANTARRAGFAGAAAPSELPPVESIDDKLRELVRLRDEGVLSYEGFAARKAELFAQL